MQTLLYFYGNVNEYVLLIKEEDGKNGVNAEEVDCVPCQTSMFLRI